jgi:quercetin dioxygenase-like cupin family protein
MKVESFEENVEYSIDKIVTKVVLESSFTKEIRILMMKGQAMKEHKTAFPIVVHVIEGAIEFGILGEKKILKKGDVIALEGNIPHDLFSIENSVVRLTLSKLDKVERVEKVVANS